METPIKERVAVAVAVAALLIIIGLLIYQARQLSSLPQTTALPSLPPRPHARVEEISPNMKFKWPRQKRPHPLIKHEKIPTVDPHADDDSVSQHGSTIDSAQTHQ